MTEQLNTVPLDLLRGRLTKLTSRIIFKLGDRSGFPLNSPIYTPGAVSLTDGSGLSFFEFAVKGLEEYHGALGRWEYPDEYPLMTSAKPVSMADREVVGLPPIPVVDINTKDRLLPFYTDDLLPKLCESSDDPSTYGETAYIDADIVLLMNERINLGRFVAASKVNSNPNIWEIVPNTDELTQSLRDSVREQVVIDGALEIASRHRLSGELTQETFRWIIDRTMDVEVDYLQALHSQH